MFDRLRARLRKILGLPGLGKVARPRVAVAFQGGCSRCGHLETRCNETQIRCAACGAFLRRVDDARATICASLPELAKQAWTIRERFGAAVAIVAVLFFARGAQGA